VRQSRASVKTTEIEKGVAGIVVGFKDSLPTVIDTMISGPAIGTSCSAGGQDRGDREVKESCLIISRPGGPCKARDTTVPAGSKRCGPPQLLLGHFARAAKSREVRREKLT
jgi:hypothetical protein